MKVEAKNQIDIMCLVRYALYGALIGGALGNLASPRALFVYGAAALVSVLFVLAKWRFIT